MPKITHTHTHYFDDGESVAKDCTMTFYSFDNDPNISKEHVSLFEHPSTDKTFTHRFFLHKNSENNERSWTDDRPGGQDSDGIVSYKMY